jgi:hypothetical protein
MKYYLLTFNEDYADEHDVPALSCMTEEEYNKWLETPSGELNSNYELEIKKFNIDKKIKENFNIKCKEILGERWGSIPFTEWPENLLKEYNELPKVNEWRSPKKLKSSKIYASLGNSGDEFNESYMNYYLMKEFLEDKTVKVIEVNEDFYNTFHKAKLSSLSLCNIFKIDNY